MLPQGSGDPLIWETLPPFQGCQEVGRGEWPLKREEAGNKRNVSISPGSKGGTLVTSGINDLFFFFAKMSPPIVINLPISLPGDLGTSCLFPAPW